MLDPREGLPYGSPFRAERNGLEWVRQTGNSWVKLRFILATLWPGVPLPATTGNRRAPSPRGPIVKVLSCFTYEG
jgi:hypothetical protein